MEGNLAAKQSLNRQYANIKGAGAINDVAVGFGRGWIAFAILSTLASAFSFYQDFYKSLGVVVTIILVVVLAVALETFKHLSIRGMFSSMNPISRGLVSIIAVGLIGVSFYTHFKSIQTFKGNLINSDLQTEIAYQRDLQRVQNSQISSILASNQELAKALNNGTSRDDEESADSTKSNNQLIITLSNLAAKNNMTNTNLILKTSRASAETTSSAILVIFFMIEIMALFSILSKIIVVDNVSDNLKEYMMLEDKLQELESTTYQALGQQRTEQAMARMNQARYTQEQEHNQEMKRIGNNQQEPLGKREEEAPKLIAPTFKRREQITDAEEIPCEIQISPEPEFEKAIDFSAFSEQEGVLIKILWNNGAVKKGDDLIDRDTVIKEASENFGIKRAGSILTNLYDNLMNDHHMIERPKPNLGYKAKVALKKDLWTEKEVA